jgi:YD repeat-containing protein
MVAIVSGSGLGLFNTSSLLGAQSGTGSASLGQGNEQVIINSTTGNLVIAHQDEFLVSQGLDTSVIRTYNSQGLLDDDNGDNWRFNIAYLQNFNIAAGTRERVAGDGSVTTYTNDGNGTYVSSDGDGAHDTIVFDGTDYIWTDGSTGLKEHYDASDLSLVKRVDRDGNETLYSYNGDGNLRLVQDASGQTVTLTYDILNTYNVQSIATSTGSGSENRAYYEYDAQNRLSRMRVDLTPADGVITDNDTYDTTYTYDDVIDANNSSNNVYSRRIASITQSDGTTVSFAYANIDGLWRVSSFTDGNSNQTQFAYDQIIYNLDATAVASNTAQSSAVYSVKASDTWASIATLFYGTADAATALRLAVGDPALSGLQLSLPVTLTESAGETNTVWNAVPGSLTTTDTVTTYPVHSLDESLLTTPGPNVLWSQDLNTDTSGLSIDGAVHANNQIDFSYTGYNGQYVSGDRSYDFSAGVSFRAEVMVDASTEGFSVGIGSLSTSNLHEVIFYAGGLSANHHNGDYTDGVYLGAMIPGQTYVVEIDTSASGSTAYVYALGSDRSTGFSDPRNYTWTDAYFQARGYAEGSASTFQASIDNISEYTGVSAAPYYLVQTGDTWSSIAQALYGSSNVSDELQSVLGVSALNAGDQLLNMPANLTDTLISVVNVTLYYTVQSGDSWTSIASLIYNDAQAAGALSASMNHVELTAGVQLTLPAVFDSGLAYPLINSALNGTANLALWQQDFSADDSGFNGLDPNYMVLDNGRLAVSTVNQTTVDYPKALSTRPYSFNDNILYRGEITLGANPQRFISFGINNGDDGLLGNAYRQHAVSFGSTGHLLASIYDPTLGYNADIELGFVNDNTTYVIEIETLGANGTVLYVYEKGQSRNGPGAFTPHVQPAADWGNSQMFIESLAGPTQVNNTLYVDNLSEARIDGVATYVVQANQSWSDVANILYATPTLGDELAAQYGSISVGMELLNLPTSLANVQSTASARNTVITSALGQVTVYTQDAQGRVSDISQNINAQVNLNQQIEYDADDNVKAVVDGNGNRTEYDYDTRGNRILERDAKGHTLTRTYNGDNLLLTETVYLTADLDGSGSVNSPADPQTIRYVYGVNNHLRFVVSAEGNVTEYRYNTQGQREAEIQYLEAAYNISGLSENTSLSESQLQAWIITAMTDLTQTQRIDTFYDVRGNVSFVNTYGTILNNGNGDLGSVSTTQYIYDQYGQLLQRIDPRQSQSIKWQQDFSTGSSGLSSLPANYMRVENGRLIVTTQENATETWPAITGSRQHLPSDNVVYRSEITTTSSSTDRRAIYGMGGINAGGESRRHGAYFIDGNVYVHHYDNGWKSNLLGAIEDNATYIVEISLTATGSRLYLYKQGEARDSLYVDDRYYTDWMYTQTVIQGYGKTNATAGVMYIDNISETVGLSGVYSDHTTHYVYDGLGRLTLSTDAQGVQTLKSYVGAQVRTTFDNGYSSWDIFSLSGQLTSQVNWVDSGFDNFQTNTYDSAGRLRMTSDKNQNYTHILYDEANRPVMTVDAEGGLTEMGYDASGNEIFNATYGKKLSALTLNLLINDKDLQNITLATLRNEASDDTLDRIRWYAYDQSNRLIYSLNNLYRSSAASTYTVVQNVYDARGYLTDELAYQGVFNSTTLDAKNVLATAPSVADIQSSNLNAAATQNRLTRHFYDGDGNRIATLDGEGYLVEYNYNNAGQLKDTLAYATQLTDPTVQSSGDLSQIKTLIGTDGKDQRSANFYNAQGQLIGQLDTDGYLNEFQYDLAGNLVEDKRFNSPAINYTGTQTLDQIRPSNAALNRHTVNTYNSLNQLIQNTVFYNASMPLGVATVYEYNTVGQVTKTSRGVNTGDVRSYLVQYNALGQITRELSAEGGEALAALPATAHQLEINAVWSQYSTVYVYDKNGNRIRSTDQNGNLSYYYYDKENRLRYQVNAAGQVEETTYNAAGQMATQIQYAATILTNTLYPSSTTAANVKVLVDAVADNTKDRVTQLTYNLRGEITNILNAENQSTGFSYNTFGEKKSDLVVFQNSYRFNEQEYDRRGLLVTDIKSQLQPGTQTRTNQYDAFGRLTQSTDGNQNITAYNYDKNSIGQAITTVVNQGTGSSRTLTYDAFNRVVNQTDAQGWSTQFVYADNLNNLVKWTYSPNGVTTIDASNHHGELTAQVNFSDSFKSTGYQYDKNGNLTQVTDGNGHAVNHLYDDANRLIESRDENGIATRYTYDKANRITHSIVDPDVVDVVTPANNYTGLHLDTEYVYDDANNKTQVIDPNGAITETEYNRKGEVVAVIVAKGTLDLRTEYTRNEDGKLLTVTEGADTIEARVTQYVYDTLGRRTQTIVDPTGLNNITQYFYDDNNNVIAKSEAYNTADASQTRYVYDAENRETYRINGEGEITRSEYDKEGRVIRTTRYSDAIDITQLPPQQQAVIETDITTLLGSPRSTATDQIQWFAYDKSGRLIFSVDAEGSVTQRGYDGSGNVISIHRYATAFNATQILAIDAAGGNDSVLLRDEMQTYATLIADATKDQISHQVFDGANRMRYQIDSLNYITEFIYDSAGNVIQTVAYDQPYTGIFISNGTNMESLIRSVDNHVLNLNEDQITRFAYDAAGRQVLSVNALGYVSETQYDAAGQIIESIRYERAISPLNIIIGAVYEFNTTTESEIRSAINAQPATTKNQHTKTVYDNAGQIRYQIDAQNYVTETQYDARGNITQSTRYNDALISALNTGASVSDTQTALSNRVAPNTPKDQITQYQYDLADRITTETYALNSSDQYSESYAYDAQGNVIRHTDGRNNNEYFAYDNENRLTRSINQEGYVKDTAYNAFGLIKNTTIWMNASTNTATDDRWAEQTDSIIGLTVNADAVSGDRTQSFTYDKNNRLDIETNAKNVQTKYNYDGFGNATDITEAYQHATDARTTHQVFDQRNLMIQKMQAYLTADQITTEYGYDSFGNQTTIIDPRGVELATSNSVWAQAERARINAAETKAYNSDQALLTNTERNELKARYASTQSFDQLNRKESATDALGGVTSTVYDAFNNIIKVTDPNQNSGYFYYDRNNLISTQVDAAGYVTQFDYDASGNAKETAKYANKVVGNINENSALAFVTSTTNPPEFYVLIDAVKDQHTKAEYDNLNRTTQITDGENNIENFTYDAQGNVITHTDKNRNLTTYGYDAVGNKIRDFLPIQSLDALQNSVQVVNAYEYDAVNNLAKTIEAQSMAEERITSYIYDKNSQLVGTVDPQVLIGVEKIEATGTVLVGGIGDINIHTKGYNLSSAWAELTISVPPNMGYGDGNYRVVWTTLAGTVDVPVSSLSQIPVLTLGLNFLNDLSGGLSGPAAYSVRIYKETTQGEILLINFEENYPGFLGWTPYITSSTAEGITVDLYHNGEVDVNINFLEQYNNGGALRLSYWPINDVNNIVEIDLSSYSPNGFSGILVGNVSGDYGYSAKVFDINGEVVNHLSGLFNVETGITTIVSQTLISSQQLIPYTYKGYDAQGNVLTEINPNGNVTHYYYDKNNRRIASIDAENYLHEYTYDANGNMIRERTYADQIPAATNLITLPDIATLVGFNDSDYRETNRRYNANNQLIESQTQSVLVYDRVNGQRTQSLINTQNYDANGNLILTIDANGNNNYSYYNALGQQVLSIDALGYATAKTYDANGNIKQHIQYASALSTTTLNALSTTSNSAVLVAELNAYNNINDRITDYTYDNNNRLITQTIQNLSVGTIDSSGTVTETNNGATTRYEYDGLGNVKAVIQANAARTDYDYDSLSRLIKEQGASYTDDVGASVRTTKETQYDGVSNIIAEINKGKTTTDDQITRFEYDPSGNLTKEIDAKGSPKVYYYDLNGNLTHKHERRSRPDGIAPSTDTAYQYDKLNHQISTEDNKNFIYHAKYNAYGEIEAKGLNSIGQEQEYYQYDKAGRLIKTNKEGIDKAYLYDANGNATAEIQSAITDTDLQPLTIDQIAVLNQTIIKRTESSYDAKNQLIQSHQAPIQFTHDDVNIQNVWVDVMGDVLIGGLIEPGVRGTIDVHTKGYNPVDNGLSARAELTVTLPPDIVYGNGDYRVEWTTLAGKEEVSVTSLSQIPIITLGLNFLNDLSGGSAAPVGYSVRIYETTTQGEILLINFEDTYPGYLGWGPYITAQNSNGYNIVDVYRNGQLPDTIDFKNIIDGASSFDLWLWKEGGLKPTTPEIVLKQITTGGVVIDGWFAFNWSNYTDGNYNYEYKVKDINDDELDYISGTMTLGANSTVDTQLQQQAQPIVSTSPSASSIIERLQTYNAFGQILQEIDGRGNITDFVYNTRGQLIQKISPETDITLADASLVRHRPRTDYIYDIAGQLIAEQDANTNYDINVRGLSEIYVNRTRYDNAGHVIAEFNNGAGIKTYGYDEFGNRAYSENELGKRTTNTYNDLNQLVRVDRPTDATFNNVARFETYQYDEFGRRIAHQNLNGESDTVYYDDIGRVTRTIDTEGRVTRYRYIFDAATGGTKTITTLADGKTLEDSKDYFGKLINHKDLDGRVYTYQYNEAGWLTHQQSTYGEYIAGVAQAGQNIDYSYYHNGYVKDVIDNNLNRRTKYEYDNNGNRTFEGIAQATATTGQVYYQWSNAQYDELNRLQSIDDPKYNLNYEYDANGNKRHVYARYHDGLQGEAQHQDYWYTYDADNRFTITKGEFSNTNKPTDGTAYTWNRGAGVIQTGTEGVQVNYNAAGQRIGANNETYIYNDDNLLSEVQIDGIKHATRVYDAAGNVLTYSELATDGATINRQNIYTYTKDNKTKTDRSIDNVATSDYTSTYYYDAAGNLDWINQPQTGAEIRTDYTYEYWDSTKQQEIKITGTTTAYTPLSPWKPGFSKFTYDVNGHLNQVSDVVADRHLSYKLDQDGKILQRNELLGTVASRTQYFYYMNGLGVGDAGGFGQSKTDYESLLTARDEAANKTNNDEAHSNVKPVSSADFDYNFIPISNSYPATTPGTYTVNREGQSLQEIAQAVWGDSSLWYIIADANGIDQSTQLAQGQNLVIPNVVTNVHNNSDTFKVYNPGELLGNTSPTLPDAPPPPPPPKKGCNSFALIVVIVVAAVVTAGATAALSSTFLGSGFASSALGAAIGSSVSQLAAVELGVQEKFSWKSVASSALTAGILKTSGIAPGENAKIGELIKYGASQSIVSQGVNILTRQQEEFSWSSVVASAIASPITHSLTKDFTSSNAKTVNGPTLDGFGSDFATSVIGGFVSQASKIAVTGDGKVNWESIGVNAVGSSVAHSINALDVDGRRARQEKAILRLDNQIISSRERNLPFIDYKLDQYGNPVQKTFDEMRDDGNYLLSSDDKGIESLAFDLLKSSDRIEGNYLATKSSYLSSTEQFNLLQSGKENFNGLSEKEKIRFQDLNRLGELGYELYDQVGYEEIDSAGILDGFSEQGAFQVWKNNTAKNALFAFKGSSTPGDFIDDLDLGIFGGASFGGDTYDTVRADVFNKAEALANSGYSITATGHSLGGALAQSFALDAGTNLSIDVNSYVFDPLPVSGKLLSSIAADTNRSTSQVLDAHRSNTDSLRFISGGEIATSFYDTSLNRDFLGSDTVSFSSGINEGAISAGIGLMLLGALPITAGLAIIGLGGVEHLVDEVPFLDNGFDRDIVRHR